jgi:hypothetical protein
VASEGHRVELTLTNDSRLVSAVTGAVNHFAVRAGFDAAARKALIEATEQACLDTFKLLPSDDAPLGVVIEDFEDRLEITFEHTGEATPSAGLETFGIAGLEDAQSGLALLSRVDRVQYHTEEGISRMKLVKYHPPASRKP